VGAPPSARHFCSAMAPATNCAQLTLKVGQQLTPSRKDLHDQPTGIVAGDASLSHAEASVHLSATRHRVALIWRQGCSRCNLKSNLPPAHILLDDATSLAVGLGCEHRMCHMFVESVAAPGMPL
jgi:hypothetical protein